MPPERTKTGYPCLCCGARMMVSQSREANYLGEPSVRRRRRCPKCRRRVTTYEVDQKLAQLIVALCTSGVAIAELARQYETEPLAKPPAR